MYYERLSDLGIKLHKRYGSEKTQCPMCHNARKNKADKSLSVNVSTGEYKCHNDGCGFKGNVRSREIKHEKKKYEKPPQDVIRRIEIRENAEKWFLDRGITKPTLEKFLIFCKEEMMPQTSKKENCICFPYLRNGEVVNVKYRDARKNFKMHKGAELVLYNLQSIGEKKKVIIVEGEIDCLSVYEAGIGRQPFVDRESGEVMNDLHEYAMLSVPNGASSGEQKLEYLDNCFEYLIGVEEFVIATDGDNSGRRLADELIRRLGVEKCKVVNYPIEECVPIENGLKRRCKDFNEVLMYLGKEVIANCILNADFIPVEGIYYVDDIFNVMIQNFKNGIQSAPITHFGEMDKHFRWKKGEINLFVGHANHGKTTLVLQMMLTKSVYDGWKWGIFSPENYPATDFYDDLIEVYVGKWLDQMSEQEYSAAASFIDKHIFYVYPEDSHDLLSINEKFRYLVLKKGIDGVLVDPWNQLDHLQKPYQREDQYLSEALKDIKRFTLLNHISYNIVAHPVKQQKDQDKSLPPVDMYDIAGGAMFANKSDNIVSYYRPNHHIDKKSPEVEIYIQKIKRRRTGGEPGSFSMRMNWNIKRFVDPINGQPYLNPSRPPQEKQPIQQNIWLPYADKDDEPF